MGLVPREGRSPVVMATQDTVRVRRRLRLSIRVGADRVPTEGGSSISRVERLRAWVSLSRVLKVWKWEESRRLTRPTVAPIPLPSLSRWWWIQSS